MWFVYVFEKNKQDFFGESGESWCGVVLRMTRVQNAKQVERKRETGAKCGDEFLIFLPSSRVGDKNV